MDPVARLAERLTLGDVLSDLGEAYGGYALLAHHQQGEFHHDVVIRVLAPKDLPGDVLVVATNCNGGVKEVLCFGAVPTRDALWHHRCPEGDFAPDALPTLRGEARTLHHFDPCELLGADARSELLPEYRRRQPGGGWEPTY